MNTTTRDNVHTVAEHASRLLAGKDDGTVTTREAFLDDAAQKVLDFTGKKGLASAARAILDGRRDARDYALDVVDDKRARAAAMVEADLRARRGKGALA